MRHLASVLGLSVVLTAGAVPAVAAEDRSYVALGVGNNSCATWTQNRRVADQATPGSTDYRLSLTEQAWVSGFLSAANHYTFVAGSSDGDLTIGQDLIDLMGRVDIYCAAAPLDTIADAAKNFAEGLRQHKRN